MIKKVFDYTYYRMYEVTSRTNKSIPEWSTMIYLSLLLSINIIAIAFFLDVPIVRIGEDGFIAIPIFFIIINYYYFIKNNRYKEIIKIYKVKSVSSFYRVLVLLYDLLSFLFLFVSLKFTSEQIVLGLGVILAVKIVAHLFYRVQ